MKPLVLSAAVAAILGICYLIVDFGESQRVSDGISLARLSVDADAVSRINVELASGLSGAEVYKKPEYQGLVAALNRIARAFPVAAKWTYIAAPDAGHRTGSRLTVLTVEPNEADETTLPGYLYDIAAYPAMQRALYDPDDIVVSGVVWDNVYGGMTRSGFAKLRDSRGAVVGVISVDLQESELFREWLNVVLLAGLYSAGFLYLVAWGLSPRKRRR